MRQEYVPRGPRLRLGLAADLDATEAAFASSAYASSASRATPSFLVGNGPLPCDDLALWRRGGMSSLA